MPGPYREYCTQLTTQQKHAKPRHQPSDRDQRAQQCLKDKVFKAQIHDLAYITLGPTALHTVYQTFDPGFQVLFHLSPYKFQQKKELFPHYMLFRQADTVCQQLITISQTLNLI